MAHAADDAHAQGALVTWAHWPYPSMEAPLDIALGKIDSIDILTTGNPFDGYTISRYTLVVPSDDEQAGCGTEGAIVELHIDGRLSRTGVWSEGEANLDLFVGDEFMHLSGQLSCNGQSCYGPCDSYCLGSVITAYVGDVECGSEQVEGWLITGAGYGDLSVFGQTKFQPKCHRSDSVRNRPRMRRSPR